MKDVRSAGLRAERVKEDEEGGGVVWAGNKDVVFKNSSMATSTVQSNSAAATGCFLDIVFFRLDTTVLGHN